MEPPPAFAGEDENSPSEDERFEAMAEAAPVPLFRPATRGTKPKRIEAWANATPVDRSSSTNSITSKASSAAGRLAEAAVQAPAGQPEAAAAKAGRIAPLLGLDRGPGRGRTPSRGEAGTNNEETRVKREKYKSENVSY